MMRTFQGTGRNSSLARRRPSAGRIGKTLHLLDLVDDEVYRRSLLIQVNTGERRHSLARTVFRGRRRTMPPSRSLMTRIRELLEH
jgi:TnpA family transposase